MKKYQKRLISFCSAIAMMFSSLPMQYVSDDIKEISVAIRAMAYSEGESVTLDSVTKFVEYSNNYDASHINDTIILTFGDESTLGELAGFTSIAMSEDIAFNGRIVVGDGLQLNLPASMFGWITDDVDIVKSSNNSDNAILSMTRTRATSDTPLFAQHVKHNRAEGSADWSFQYDEFREDESTSNRDVFDFAGYIGTLEENASVKIDSIINNNEGILLGNNYRANVTASGDAGLVCCTMKSGSTLEIGSITSESGDFTVTGATAGGLVGSMDTGSKVILSDGLSSVQNSEQSITATGGYAGGIVGSCKGDIQFADSIYTVNQTINGTLGSGGIAGYFEADGGNFSFSSFELGTSAQLNGSGDCGGFFGKLKNTGDMTLTDGKGVSANHKDGTANSYGGLIGTYESRELADSLTVKSTAAVSPKKATGDANNYGGVIGTVAGSSYVKFDGVTVSSSNTNAAKFFGGLVGVCDSGYIDLTGTNKITYTGLNSGRTFGGIVGSLNNGVLILAGTTDLSDAVNIGNGTVTSGQIVGERENGFIWAESGWSFTRSTSGATLDDVGSWGEVLNHSGGLTSIKEELIELSGHSVTIKEGSSAISDLKSFALTALNIQHNNGTGNDVIKVTEGCKSETLLGSDITLNGTINLSKTGLTGLTRDNGTNASYSKSLSGSGSVTLAVGEEYAEGSADNGNGRIYRHQYNGLIAKTNNATISGITISEGSKIDVEAHQTNMSIGSLAACSEGQLTIDGVTVKGEIDHAGDSSNFCIGGMVGKVQGSVNIGNTTACTYNGRIKGDSGSAVIGGVVGEISNGGEFTSSVKNTSVSGTITAASENVGGMIAAINASTTASSSRTLALNNVDISGLSITNTHSSDATGGFLGYTWKSTDVTFDDVAVIGNSTLTVSTPSAAGLVYLGTGYWKVNAGGISINGAAMKADSATSFGVLLNKSQSDDKALYLELCEGTSTQKAYKINKNTLTLSLDACTVFDEILAYSASSADKVLTNGQSVVSINTYDGTNTTSRLLKMGSSDTNTGVTYQNQTDFATKYNPNTRYYYNLDKYRTSPADGAEKLLVWSVYQYAHSSIQHCFTAGDVSSLSGTFDMRGYSYYPVDLSSSLTISGTLALHNPDFDTSEGTTDDKRKSTDNAQHYLIHNALIHNLTGTLNVNTLTLDGEVSKIGNKAGFLVYDTISSSSSAKPAALNINGLTLGGVKIKDADGALLVGKAGSNVSIDISDVKNEHNTSEKTYYSAGQTIATALLGEIGSSEATNLKVNFTKIQLDGRKADPTADTGLDVLDSIYGTTRSLFTNATLIKSFAYQKNSGSFGLYNYERSLDWDDNGNHIGQVTYGAEIDNTAENRENGESQQLHYNASSVFTHPTTINASDKYGKFAENFQKYVASTYTEDGNYHELRVNISTTGFDGCGTYNDPYLITSGAELEKIANIINNDASAKGNFSFKVPNAVCGVNTNSKTWCADKSDHTEFYAYDSENAQFKNKVAEGEESTVTISFDALREYLAGAYYVIPDTVTEKIVLSNNYKGISLPSAFAAGDEKYIFRGVIIGNGHTIVNNSQSPLIIDSYGAVVKNLNIEVHPQKSVTEKVNNVTTTKLVDDPMLISMGQKQEFTFNNKNAQSYGAIFGRVLGGDNIIDDVSVKFTGKVINANNNATNTNSYSNGTELTPIGGYVGVVVNGGVIFRNMTGTSANGQSGITKDNLINFRSGVGSEPDNPLANDNMRWLYVNPIIGRVINGYAVTESSAYRPYENGKRVFYGGAHTEYNAETKTYDVIDESELVTETWAAGAVTMRNGTKNYSITDISKSEGKLSLNSASNITAPNGQAFFLMACMVNSGMAKKALGYNQSYQVSRYAEYTHVGETTMSADYTTASADVLGTNGICSQPGYLAHEYTDNATNAANMANQTTTLNLSENGTYVLPDGYKGLGNNYNDDDAYRLKVATLNGNGATISQNTEFYYCFNVKNDNSTDKCDYYQPISYYGGIALINYQNLACTVDNLILKGNIIADAFNITTGKHIPYKASINNWSSTAEKGANYGADGINQLSAGALIGHSANTLTIEESYLNNVYVRGMKNAGGMIGAIGDGVTTITNSTSDSKKINVHGATTTGGLIGRNNKGNLIVDMGGMHFNLTEVISECETNAGLIAYDSLYGVGGIVGCTRSANGDNNHTGSGSLDYRTSSFKNINIGDSEKDVKMTIQALNQPILTGGIAGVFDRTEVIIENCHLYNLDLTAKYYAGGVFAQIGTSPNTRNQNNGRFRELTIKNVTIEKTSNYSGTPRIVSTDYSAGGLFACAKQDLQRNLCVTNCEISDYLIKGKEFSGGACAVWSFTQDQNVSTTTTKPDWKYNLVIKNTKISDCELAADDSIGGLVGVNNVHHQVNPSYTTYQSANIQYIYGYNILTKNLTFSSYTYGGTPKYMGCICGYNQKAIMITGYSRQGDMTEKLVGECDSSDENIFGRYGEVDGYCVFADYDDKAETNSKSEIYSPINGEYNVPPGTNLQKVLKYTTTIIETTDSEGTTTSRTNNVEELDESEAVTAYKKTVIVDNKLIDTAGKYKASDKNYSRYITIYESLKQENTKSNHLGKLGVYREYYTYKADGTYNGIQRETGNTGAFTGGVQDNYKYTNAQGTEITLPMNITDETVTEDNKQTGIKTVTHTITTIVNVYDNFPYVTSSPKTYITDDQFLTGDAVAKTGYLNSTTQHILNDISSNTAKSYQNTGLTADQIAAMKNTLSDKMLGFSAAHNFDMSEYQGKEFPVLVIDDIDSASETINSYLRILTNTNFDFYVSNDAYNIDISKMVYNTETKVFERSADEAALKLRPNYGFKITSTDVDNASLQFSLLDVQFKDPSLTDVSGSGTYAVAYHLYVPVVVKKMLHYGFKARFSSGTTYDLSTYPARVCNLIENLGNPVTLKFTYTYRQKADEWADAINSGENVQRNYDKELTFKATPDIFPDGAELVLLDPNNNADKYYTADFKGENSVLVEMQKSIIGGVEVTEYRLKLSEFTGFEVCKINNLMTVSLDAEAETKTLVAAAEGEACTVIINDGSENNGLRLRPAEDGEEAQYAVSVSLPEEQEYPEENYYLSFFTKPDSTDNKIYHYEISSTNTFGDSEYPSARVSNETAHLFLGNLYSNEVELTELNENREMSGSNNYLEATLNATVGFTENAVKGGITDYIANDNVAIYQTFLTSLNMLDKDENSNSINSRGLLVKPNATVSDYTVAGEDRTEYLAPCKYSSSYVEIPNSYSIKNDLRDKARSGANDYSIKISTTIKMVYGSDMLEFQFPESEESATDVGTYMIGYSNLSSSPGRGAASRASVNTEKTPLPPNRKLYYMRNITPVEFSYNAVLNENFMNDGNGNFGQLGINANEETADSVRINTAATYDTSGYGLRTRANYVKIQVKLSKKNDYDAALDIPTYLDGFELLDKDGNDIKQNLSKNIKVEKNAATHVYTYIVPKTVLKTVSDNVYFIPINFNAYTGYTNSFEKKNGADMQYSNYRMTVTVGLLEKAEDTEVMTNSSAFDHVIYTNARLISDIVTPKE